MDILGTMKFSQDIQIENAYLRVDRWLLAVKDQIQLGDTRRQKHSTTHLSEIYPQSAQVQYKKKAAS